MLALWAFAPSKAKAFKRPFSASSLCPVTPSKLSPTCIYFFQKAFADIPPAPLPRSSQRPPQHQGRTTWYLPIVPMYTEFPYIPYSDPEFLLNTTLPRKPESSIVRRVFSSGPLISAYEVAVLRVG